MGTLVTKPDVIVRVVSREVSPSRVDADRIRTALAVIVEVLDSLLGLLSDARTLQALKGNGNGKARDSTGASVEEIALTVRKTLAEFQGRRRYHHRENGGRAIMRCLILAAALFVGLAAPAWADFDVGMMAYDRGDFETALREWRPLAEQGDAKAQYYLGVMYLNGLGVLEDYSEASAWYHKAGQQGLAMAQFVLGHAYNFGKLGLQQDFVTAVKWYRRSAEQGLAVAQNILAHMYVNGKGVPEDYFEAVKWYQEAANQGYASAQLALGELYEDGKGVPQHYGDAVKLYRRAAEQGYPVAQTKLGEMYSKGKGIQQDNVMAHMWFNLAAVGYQKAAVGYQKQTDVSTPSPFHNENRMQDLRKRADINFKLSKHIAKERDNIAKEMNPEEIAEAQKLAREWQPKFEPR